MPRKPVLLIVFGGLISALSGINKWYGWFRSVDWLKTNFPGAYEAIVNPSVEWAMIAAGLIMSAVGCYGVYQHKAKRPDKRDSPPPPPSVPPPSPPTPVNTTHGNKSPIAGRDVNQTNNFLPPKYSSTQTVESSSAPGDYTETLNLDNVATMACHVPADHNSVTMMLLASPQLEINEPVAGKTYKHAGSDMQFPGAGLPGITMRQVASRAGYRLVFDCISSPVHVIEVGARRFRVTLQSVKDKSSKTQKLLAYTFGISEE